MDKAIHLAASFVLTLLIHWSLGRRLAVTFAAAAIVGGGVELAQFFIPGRSPAMIDLVANLAGAALACILLHLFGDK